MQGIAGRSFEGAIFNGGAIGNRGWPTTGKDAGVVARDYFNLQEPIVYVLCGVSGVFSESILDELEENIKNVSVIVKSKFGASTPEITENTENE